MSFMYPRTLTIKRPTQATAAGANVYAGVNPGLPVGNAAGEAVIATGLVANIQIDRTGQKAIAGLPADPIGQPTFRIFLPQSATNGLVTEDDILIDDLGKRYQVVAVEWQQIGTQIRAQLRKP